MTDVRLDSKGIAQVLKSGEVAIAVRDLAESVATQVRAIQPDADEVVVDSYQTDRAAASVTIKDARGRLWAVRDGLLFRAAAANGLEVTEKP